MSDRRITLLQLYPQDMNIYGDHGNALVLQRRLQWRGYQVDARSYNPGDTFPDDVDLIVGGGGQDSGQGKIEADLLALGPRLRDLADADVPMLMVCGLYQLFGHSFETVSGEVLEGIGVLDCTTYGKTERLIGNTIVDSDEFGAIVGYENHSGQTFLGPGATPLGRVRLGSGNNTVDGTEGARYRNVIGTYLHGSVLPKNPAIADFLIATAVRRKYGEALGAALDDRDADLARQAALRRPR